jgi:hypothetical protein
MARDIKTIQNVTGVVQKIIFEDRIETILPYATRDVPIELAIAFRARRPGHVIEYTPAIVPAPLPGESMVWLANATGNPWLPKKLVEKVVRKGEEQAIELDNPLREPRCFSAG